MLFHPALRRLGCDLTVYLSPNSPYVCFVVGALKGQGAIFGSACRLDQDLAIEAATTECLRKLAFCDPWRNDKDESNELSKAANYWLTPVGLEAVNAFCRRSVESNSADRILPAAPDPHLSQDTVVRGRTVSFYQDPEFELPEVSECRVPLL
jgi:hypothetical protein